MENKINIAELLKDCPRGMELDCVSFNNVTFECVSDEGIWIKYIDLESKSRIIHLTPHGEIELNHIKTVCVIFPKGKTTWEGFVPPCKFKDGDVIFTHANCLKVGLGNTWISIFQEKRNGGIATYVDMSEDGEDYYDYIGDKGLLCMDKDIMRQRLATEEEKQKLFDAIKAKGYKWNAEIKTLEKLIEPYFKVGDKIKSKEPKPIINIIAQVYENYYELDDGGVLPLNYQDNWELVPKKFDIGTLVPFESRVLVRDTDHYEWEGAVFGRYDGNSFFTIGGVDWKYCIPYEGNEHLFGTTNDCDDFFKTWEE